MQSYLIYVPGRALFTSSHGRTILIPKNDSNIYIPCSVSDPKIQVSLQLLDGGGRKKPIANSNEVYVYDPRKGFSVNINKIQDPEGTYICIARYNKVLRRVDYSVTRGVTANFNFDREPQNLLEFKQRPTETCVGESCGNRCDTHTDCPAMMNCNTDHLCRDPCNYEGDPTKECFSI